MFAKGAKIRQLELLKASIISTRVLVQTMAKMPPTARRPVDGRTVADAAAKAAKAGHRAVARDMVDAAAATVPAGVDEAQWRAILEPALQQLIT